MRKTLSFKRVRNISKRDSFVMSVCVHLPVHMEQRGSHWKDLYEMLYLGLFETLSRKFKFN